MRARSWINWIPRKVACETILYLVRRVDEVKNFFMTGATEQNEVIVCTYVYIIRDKFRAILNSAKLPGLEKFRIERKVFDNRDYYNCMK